MPTEDVNAIMQGFARGNQQMGGVLPSAQNVGGAAPANVDYAASDFEAARRALSSLANRLHQNGEEKDANRVVKLLTQITDISMERRKKFADAFSDKAAGSSPVLGSLNAQGVPRQGM